MPRRKVRLAQPMFGEAEARAAATVIRSGMVTQGQRVRQFERKMLHFLGVEGPGDRDAVMVNSGSSANLLATERIVAENKHRRKVVTPALTWSTTVAPLLQRGLEPVFVDVGDDLTMDPASVQAALDAHEDVAAVLPVHLAGHPAHMTELEALARESGALLFEDCCEALGASWEGRSVGRYGDLASFSFYLSHHCNTVEGGLLVFAADKRVRAWREHGWVRDYPEMERQEFLLKDEGLDARWVFDHAGYNLRSTEINAALGLLQLRHQRAWQKRRIAVADWYAEFLQSACFLHPYLSIPDAGRPNPFSYPLVIPPGAGVTRRDLAEWLEQRGVETRPIMSGNITRHPWLQRERTQWRSCGDLATTDIVHENGLLLPCHPGLVKSDLLHVWGSIQAFFQSRGLPLMEEV